MVLRPCTAKANGVGLDVLDDRAWHREPGQSLVRDVTLPRFIVFVDQLPRNAYGKVLKRDLAQTYASLADDSYAT
jgi:acyl-coenzyme A synthetase/AMP-(fatty) acid ligase